MRGGMLYINDEAVKREPAGEWEGEGRFGAPAAIKEYRETLPNGVSYITLDMTDKRAGRQYRHLRGAARPLLHDGRQP